MINHVQAKKWLNEQLNSTDKFSDITDVEIINIMRNEFKKQRVDKLMVRMTLATLGIFPVNPLGKRWYLNVNIETSPIIKKLGRKPKNLTNSQKTKIVDSSNRYFALESKKMLDRWRD